MSVILRERVKSGEPVIGVFVKTTSPQTVEVLVNTGLDFLILDAEHAPFGQESLSQCLAIAYHARFPVLVRVPDHGPAFINACLDSGAAGILVPHVRSPSDVDMIADATRYCRGHRGFTPSSRAGAYGTTPAGMFRDTADAHTTIWCQIEDAEALPLLDKIAAHEAIDCLFIGPMDLSLSLKMEGPDDPQLEPILESIIKTARQHGRAAGLFVSGADQIRPNVSRGVSIIVCGSDQSILLNGGRLLATQIAGARSG
jgi:2-keto-3-deoxy-L-rhamnonate aldolase RhmA